MVDYPNSTKAKKFFLVLMTAGGQKMPEPLGTGAAENQVAYEQRRYHFWCLCVIADQRSKGNIWVEIHQN